MSRLVRDISEYVSEDQTSVIRLKQPIPKCLNCGELPQVKNGTYCIVCGRLEDQDRKIFTLEREVKALKNGRPFEARLFEDLKKD